ncbi:MAG TPA: DUF6600 domain-containing protein [Bryobacteraceae bacterium]|nr:DUF6600 domain-containing protein [Bryobacteraceae bacterium]
MQRDHELIFGRLIFRRILFGLALSASLLLAQQGDPPGRVARLSYMYHSVSFLPAGVDDWVPANYGRPLTTGDRVFADVTASAELQTGVAALRLGSETSLEILNLDDANTQLSLTQGTLLVRLRALDDQGSFEVDTPNLAFSLSRPGEYRIDVTPNNSATIVMVREGEGELTGADQAFTVRAGEQAQVVGTDQPSYQVLAAPERGQLENWAYDRDQRWQQSPSARYVSRETIGFEDLDRYGSWRDTPDYGAVWVPSGVGADWAPYHYGHWAWVEPWGWTWVDDAPWGFAPFHYGRWAFIAGTWGWVPGPVRERPIYAPALVAWVGGGAIGGGVAWFPLGPHEVYVPSYRTSREYITRVNVTNTVIVNNVVNVNVTNVNYVNRNAPRAVMAVQQTAFVRARPVQSAAIVVRPEALRGAPIAAAAAVAPTRESIARPINPGVRVAAPPAAIQTRAVVARRPPPPPPVPFERKQAALAANGGRPLDPGQVQQIRQAQPAPQRPAVRQVQARPAAAAPRIAPGARPAPVPTVRQVAPPAQAEPPVQRPIPTPAAPAPQARPSPAPPPQRPIPTPEARPAAPPVERPAPIERQPAPAVRPTPVPPRPAPEERPAPEARPAPRPAPEARPAPRPAPEERPAPEARPAPRPAPEARPTPAPRPAPEARPAPAERPAPRPARPPQRKEDEKDKKKE